MSNDTKYSDCKQLFAVLSEYLDTELPPADCDAIRAHVANCPPCVKFVESLEQTIQLCREGTNTELPPLDENVRKKLLAAYQGSLPEGRYVAERSQRKV